MTVTSTFPRRGAAGAVSPMVRTVACLDGSKYAASVCDHAAWLAGAGDDDIDLLHVIEPPALPSDGLRLVREGGEHLEQLGARLGRMFLLDGDFQTVAKAETADADAIVLGKRGETSPDSRRALGSNTLGLLRTTQSPILAVSQLYLPIHRALVLIDADPGHRRAVEFVAQHPGLCALSLNIILMQPIGMDPEPKLTWAREAVVGCEADVYPLASGKPDDLARAYVEGHGVDLIVMSRQMLFDQERGLGLPLEHRDLWALRTPMLIC